MRQTRLGAIVGSAAVLAATAGVLVVAGGSATAANTTSKKTTMTFVSWGGTSQDAQVAAWMKPYEKAHPDVNIVEVNPNDYAKLKAMVQAKQVTWDLVTVGNDFGLAADQTKLLTKIDCKLVPCSQLQPKKLPTSGYRVPETVLGVVMTYNTKTLGSQKPQNWADFFDTTKFPGKRALWNWSGSGVIEAALLADGVPPAKLYPLDVPRALKKLESIKSDIIWFDSPAQCTQLLSDGEAAMAMCPNGRAYTAAQNKLPVAIQWNQAILTADYLVIPKGAPHAKEAMDLMAYMTSAQHNAAYSYQLPYGPTNVKALGKANPKIKADLPSSHLSAGVFQNDRWYAKYGAKLDTTFQAWLQTQ